MEDYAWGGGPMRSGPGREIQRLKQEQPEEYAKLMRPARIRAAFLYGSIPAFGIFWMIFCLVIAK